MLNCSPLLLMKASSKRSDAQLLRKPPVADAKAQLSEAGTSVVCMERVGARPKGKQTATGGMVGAAVKRLKYEGLAVNSANVQNER